MAKTSTLVDPFEIASPLPPPRPIAPTPEDLKRESQRSSSIVLALESTRRLRVWCSEEE
jgi:hypothetical protein